MISFKQYIENLWGEIPWPYRKPSDGPGGLDTNPSKNTSGPGGVSSSMGGQPQAAPMMMKKKMGKKMRKA